MKKTEMENLLNILTGFSYCDSIDEDMRSAELIFEGGTIEITADENGKVTYITIH